MKTLTEYFKEAKKNGQAIGHFNFATADVLRVIVEGSKEAGASCVMVGTSEGEADFFGLKEAVALVKVMKEEYDFPVFLNADHFRSFETCKSAIDAGYDSVIIDPKIESYERKVITTKEVVEYARAKNPEITVEGEMGYLQGTSEVHEKIKISVDDYTKPDEAKDFVKKTGVHRLAVVFGNFHGIAAQQNKKLDIGHFKKIIVAMPDVYYVLHGASGTGDEDVAAAIKAGITNIHFNTELRLAYKDAVHHVFHEKPGETTPYKYLMPGAEEVKKLVIAKTKLFLGR